MPFWPDGRDQSAVSSGEKPVWPDESSVGAFPSDREHQLHITGIFNYIRDDYYRKCTMSPVLTALLIPFLGTALGSAFVFFMKRDMPAMLQKVLLGFASGVMVAASVWSLIIPAIDMGEGAGAVVPVCIGLLAGFAFLLCLSLKKVDSQRANV